MTKPNEYEWLLEILKSVDNDFETTGWFPREKISPYKAYEEIVARIKNDKTK